jgi:hypothetical protein
MAREARKGGEKMRLNHSRYLDYGAKAVGDRAYEQAKSTPTAKQKRFFKKLFAMCKENGIDPSTGRYAVTRVDYAIAIDTLITKLKEKGVNVKGNEKEAAITVHHGVDGYGRFYGHERILIKTEEENE